VAETVGTAVGEIGEGGGCGSLLGRTESVFWHIGHWKQLRAHLFLSLFTLAVGTSNKQFGQ